MRIAQSVADLENFAQLVKDESEFDLQPIKLSAQQDWLVKDDALSHKSGGFFSLCGYRDRNFEALVLFQPQGAFNGMAIHVKQGRIYLLLQARVEPGNSGVVQYGPTVQSTPANYLRLHGGKKTAYLEFFFEYRAGVRVLENSTQLDLGKRYYQKTKILSYIQLETMCTCEENMIWVPLDIAAQTVGHDNFLNTDLRSMLGVFDWDSIVRDSRTVNTTGNISFPLKQQSNSGGLVSLKQLDNWQLSDQGIDAVGDIATAAKLYRVTSINREVAQWVQPLFLCPGTGLILLYQRSHNGKRQFLVRLGTEFGVSNSKVYLPSEIFYGDENIQVDIPEGKVLLDLVQSEEGGRFMQNENRYQLIEVEDEMQLDQEHVWLSISEFKTLLATSNLVSIQLRCIASLVLADLNPLVLSDQYAPKTKLVTNYNTPSPVTDLN